MRHALALAALALAAIGPHMPPPAPLDPSATAEEVAKPNRRQRRALAALGRRLARHMGMAPKSTILGASIGCWKCHDGRTKRHNRRCEWRAMGVRRIDAALGRKMIGATMVREVPYAGGTEAAT